MLLLLLITSIFLNTLDLFHYEVRITHTHQHNNDNILKNYLFVRFQVSYVRITMNMQNPVNIFDTFS